MPTDSELNARRREGASRLRELEAILESRCPCNDGPEEWDCSCGRRERAAVERDEVWDEVAPLFLRPISRRWARNVSDEDIAKELGLPLWAVEKLTDYLEAERESRIGPEGLGPDTRGPGVDDYVEAGLERYSEEWACDNCGRRRRWCRCDDIDRPER